MVERSQILGALCNSQKMTLWEMSQGLQDMASCFRTPIARRPALLGAKRSVHWQAGLGYCSATWEGKDLTRPTPYEKIFSRAYQMYQKRP